MKNESQTALKKERISGISTPKSLLDVLGDTSEKMAGKWGQLIGLCSVAGVSCALLFLFPVFGLALSFFASGFLMLGLHHGVMLLLKGKNPPVEEVFSMWKQSLSAFALRILQLFFIAMWSLLLIVPGIIAALNYCFAFAVVADNPNTDAVSALSKSKNMTYGHRWELFLIYLYIFLITALVFATAMIIPFIFSFFMPVSTAWLLGSAGIIAFFVFVVAIMPYSEVILVSYYLEVKKLLKEETTTKKKKKTDTDDVLALDSDLPIVGKGLTKKKGKAKEEKK